MPLSRYDKNFGGKKGSARKAKRNMQKFYGKEKGEQVFYATKNKNAGKQRRTGSDREQLMEAFKRRGKNRRHRG